MVYDCWRGMVGIIKPTKGSGSLVELIKLLPEGIGVIPLFNHVRHGTIEEFQGAIPAYEEKIAELAQDKVDLIHPAGTPPFMLLGYKGEAESGALLHGCRVQRFVIGKAARAVGRSRKTLIEGHLLPGEKSVFTPWRRGSDLLSRR